MLAELFASIVNVAKEAQKQPLDTLTVVAYEDEGKRTYIRKNDHVEELRRRRIDTTRVTTLQGVIDFVHAWSKSDRPLERFAFVHVRNSHNVALLGNILGDGARDTFCVADVEGFEGVKRSLQMKVGELVVHTLEAFHDVAVEGEDASVGSRADLLSFIGSVKHESGVEVLDDGVSQKMELKKGTHSFTETPRKLYKLYPRGGFDDVAPQAAYFVLRALPSSDAQEPSFRLSCVSQQEHEANVKHVVAERLFLGLKNADLDVNVVS